MEIDLDAARAARAEAEHEETTFVFGGETFHLPRELPFTFAEAATIGMYRQAMIDALGEEQGERFFALKPTISDVETLIERMGPAYTGQPLPKSSDSKSSSGSTSRSSRPHSSRPTV